MLTAAQRASYDEWGYCVVPAAFDRVDAEAMAASIWHELDQEMGIRLNDPTTWRYVKGTDCDRLRRRGVFHAIASQRLNEGVDDLLGRGVWTDPRGWGGLLLTLPERETMVWDVPYWGWHTDMPCRPVSQSVRMFAYLTDVRPHGGGTLLVAGSHRVAAAWAKRNPDSPGNSSGYRKSLRGSEPWFADLFGRSGAMGTRAARFMDEAGEALGVPVRVVELSGDAGDVVLWHPSLLHAAGPNARREPRVMLTHTIHRLPSVSVDEPVEAQTPPASTAAACRKE